MKLKNFFIEIFKKFQGGVSRFISSFIITFAIFLILSIEILSDLKNDFLTESLISLSMGLTFSIFFVVLGERLKVNKIITHLASIIPTVLCYIIIKIDIIADYFFMGYFGIIFALGCCTLCLLYSENNEKTLIPHILKSIFFATLVCGLLNTGIMICLWAIETLIFNFDSDIYLVVVLFIWIVVFANTILAYIPKRDEEIVLPKLFNTIIVKITLPVYLFLVTILYIYLIKIVVTRNMPIGQINWFASYASLFFVLFAFCVKPYEDKLSKVFSKFSGYAIIPIVIMQLIAIYERVSAYGLTTPRIVSLILVGISIIFAVVSILNKKLHKVWWAVGIIILLFTLVPKINIIDLPKASQINLLEKYLVKNNMLVDNKIVPNENVEKYDRERIVSAYDYLMDAAGELPVWLTQTDTRYEDILGFPKYYQQSPNYVYCYYSSNKENNIDISQYKTMCNIINYGSDDNKIHIVVDGVDYGFDVRNVFDILHNKYGIKNYDVELINLTDSIDLYITSASFNYFIDDDLMDTYNIEGYLFAK